jgi:hypothetical protein
MTETQAEQAAAEVRLQQPGPVRVLREGRYFVVLVETATGEHVLRDEQDARWLAAQG